VRPRCDDLRCDGRKMDACCAGTNSSDAGRPQVPERGSLASLIGARLMDAGEGLRPLRTCWAGRGCRVEFYISQLGHDMDERGGEEEERCWRRDASNLALDLASLVTCTVTTSPTNPLALFSFYQKTTTHFGHTNSTLNTQFSLSICLR
jgi:hypothetical protein